MREYCEICNEPITYAKNEAELICESCDKVICEKCLCEKAPVDMDCGYKPVWCVECGRKYLDGDFFIGNEDMFLGFDDKEEV